jgi:hypothetical protein
MRERDGRDKPYIPPPSTPYQRGKAPPLTLCPECKCYMPKQHDCRPIE